MVKKQTQGHANTDMDINWPDMNDWMYNARREFENEIERLEEKSVQLRNYMRALDAMGELLAENDSLKEENGRLGREYDRLQKEVEKKDMKLSELSKLSVGVAKKSSQDEVLKALRTYINISKRKTLSKRAAVKMVIMELANAIGLVFPEDMVATLEALDDEQSEPKVLVQGNMVMNAPTFNGPMYDVRGNEEVKFNG